MPKEPKVTFQDEEEDEMLSLIEPSISVEPRRKIRKMKKEKKRKSKKDKKKRKKSKKDTDPEEEKKEFEQAGVMIIENTRRWEDDKTNGNLKRGKFEPEETQKLMHALCQYIQDNRKTEQRKFFFRTFLRKKFCSS